MARKTSTVTIEDEGRDFGKVFILTEMPSDQGEQWAIRALLALSNAGVNLPDGAAAAGFAGFAAAGIEALGKLSFDIAKPLLDEMFECVQIKPSVNVPARPVLGGVGGDIEEIKTRFKLRMAVLSLHVNFSVAVVPPTTLSPQSVAGTPAA